MYITCLCRCEVTGPPCQACRPGVLGPFRKKPFKKPYKSKGHHGGGASTPQWEDSKPGKPMGAGKAKKKHKKKGGKRGGKKRRG